MHNTTPTPTPSVSIAAAVCLAVAAVAAFALVVLVYVDLFTPLDPARGITGLFAAVCSVAGFGYLSRSAEDRIGRREAAAVRLILNRIDELEQRMDGHAAKLCEQGEQGYAAGFVDGAAGGRTHLSVVSQG